jgi:class 3 adenylate cyclase/tetratricopeptide (TPR) repeat protein
MGDSPAFEDWALAVRERLEHQFSNALQALAANYEQRGAYARACGIARRWVTHVPWQEQAHQELMRLLALSGQRGAALAQFEACCRALHEELDVDPSEGTVRLYERIRDQDLSPPTPVSALDRERAGASPSSTLGSTRERPPVAQRGAAPLSLAREERGLGGEHRLVTVLVALVAAHTAQARPVGVDTQVQVMQHVFPLLVDEVERYGGEVERYLDDGLIALFGASTVHEDDPERAVLAALAMAKALPPHLDTLAGRHPIHLSLRTGVSTGEAVTALVGDRQHVWAEAAIDQALALAGENGQARTPNVRVAADTHRLVAPLFEWAPGSTRVDGRGLAYRPLRHRERQDKGRGIPGLASPLVGRERERLALQGAIERLQLGLGGIVTVVGEAGIGKSRLVTEVRKDNPAKVSEPSQGSDLQWLEGRCLSYSTNVAYGLWQDMLRGALGTAPGAPPDDVRAALHACVADLCPDCAEDVYPYLGRVLALPLEEEYEARLHGLDAESLRHLTFRAAEVMLARAAAARPVVVVCEDLHWADPTSLSLLAQLLPLADQVPLLLICVFRPERAHGCWRIVEVAVRHYAHCYTGLRLDPLSPDQSAALVGNLLHANDLPHGLRAQILQHGGGNPFYVEEILRSLIDSGIVVYDETTGQHRATRDLEDIPVPDTLHEVLAARIDRLPDRTRRVLQQAAAIGRIFGYPVLSAIATGASRQFEEASSSPQLEGASSSPRSEGGGWEGDNLLQHLVALERAELIHERARLPEREYAFKHVLTQEAAYNGILQPERLGTHRRIAEALEQLYAERTNEHLGLLAYHWEQAGEKARAAGYLQRAGEQAAAQYANDEAIGYLSRALALTPEDDLSRRYALLLARERVYELRGAHQAWSQDLEALAAVASALDDDAKRAAVACRRARYAIGIEDHTAAIIAAREAVDLARAAGDVVCEIRAQIEWGTVLRWQLDYQAAASHSERALALARAAGLRQAEAESLMGLSILSRVATSPAAALAYAEQALHISRQLGNRRGEGGSLEHLGVALMGEGAYGRALARLQESLHTYREIGCRRGEALALGYLGMAYGEAGECRQAREEGERALAVSRAIHDSVCESIVRYTLSCTAIAAGDYAGARACLEQRIPSSGRYPMHAAALLPLVTHLLGDDEAAHDYARQAVQAYVGDSAPVFYWQHWVGVLGYGLCLLGQPGPAAEVYRRALALQHGWQRHHLIPEPLAGLARIAMENGDTDQALAHVNEILGHIEARPALEGTTAPLLIYLTCYQVLRACDDPRAGPLLEAGYQLLHERASQMDEGMRRSYLENVPYHRSLVAAWEQQ